MRRRPATPPRTPHITKEVAVPRDKGNTPAFKSRIGYVTATVWQNGEFFNVELSKSYKKDNEWAETSSLGHGDLLNAVQCLKRAEQFISEQ